MPVRGGVLRYVGALFSRNVFVCLDASVASALLMWEGLDMPVRGEVLRYVRALFPRNVFVCLDASVA